MASGETLAVLKPLAASYPSANFATLFRRNAHWLLAFDQTTEESVFWELLMPRFYGGGALTAYVHWVAASPITSGTFVAGIAIERISAGNFDIDADGYDTEDVSAADTADSVSGEVVVTTVAVTHRDSIAAGEPFRVKLARKVASDNLAGDVQVLMVELREA